uniref:Probable RNA-binding protein EIF1AD n=1 Tax=Acrobeloides nanus TaxID=290746 RepID=A0A914CL91_9BILA
MELVLPTEKDLIAQLGNVRGNHLHEVVDENGENYLASMPTKFRHTVWVKRGQFVILQPIEEGDKVRAEILYVLDAENIKYIHEKGRWPKRFDAEAEKIINRSKPTSSAFIDSDLLPPSDSEEEEDMENLLDVDNEEDQSDSD